MRRAPIIALVAAGLAAALALGRRRRRLRPGPRKPWRMSALESGSALFQSFRPVKQFDAYIVGFHTMKEEPRVQVETHRYCFQLDEDLMQCVLFDGNGKDARLVGVEYVISESLFERLPEDERPLWHPHNYEILSGHWVAPGLPEIAERQLMKLLLNSYGKAFHTWVPGLRGALSQAVPLGDPLLAWSFNRDGEARRGLVEDRDRRVDVDSHKRRARRAGLAGQAHPQSGADDLCFAFKT